MVAAKKTHLILGSLILAVLIVILGGKLSPAFTIYTNAAPNISQCGNITQPGVYVLNQSFNFTTGPACVMGALSACLCIQNDSIIIKGQFENNSYSITGPNNSSDLWAGIYISSKTNITIENTTLNAFTHGLILENVSASSFLNVTLVSNNASGLNMSSSTTLLLRDMVVISNGLFGILVNNNSNYNTFANISSYGNGLAGLNVLQAANNSFSRLSLRNNPFGLLLSVNATNNTFTESEILNSTQAGIALRSSALNIFRNGLITSTHAINTTENGSIDVRISWGNTFENISIFQTPSIGIFVHGSDNNTFGNSTINGTWSDSIQIVSGVSNLFANITIVQTNASHYDLNISEYANGSILFNMPLIFNYSIGTSPRNDSNGSTLIFKNRVWGEIQFSHAFNATGTYLSNEFTLANNSFYINLTKFGTTKLLMMIMHSIPTELEGYEIKRDSVASQLSACYNLTSLSAGTVRFNATGGNSYFIDGDEPAEEDDSDDSEAAADTEDEVATSYWSLTTSKADKEFSVYEVLNVKLKARERFRIKVDGVNHHVGVISLTTKSVKVNVSSTPQQESMDVGDSAKFELTNDTYYDLKLTLNKIVNSSANLTLNYIHEEKTKTVTTVSQNKTNSTTRTASTVLNQTNATTLALDTPKSKTRGKIWMIIGIIVLLGVLGGSIYFYWMEQMKFNILKQSVKVKSP